MVQLSLLFLSVNAFRLLVAKRMAFLTSKLFGLIVATLCVSQNNEEDRT